MGGMNVNEGINNRERASMMVWIAENVDQGNECRSRDAYQKPIAMRNGMSNKE